MKKILSYVAYQRKLNIGVDLKNRGTQLDIYDFMEIEVIPQSYTSYYNTTGNCKMCAICDYMNILFNNGNAVYVPVPIDSSNVKYYNRLASFTGWDSITSLKECGCHSLNDIVNKNINCILSICCKGGYHAIAFVNGKFYNNWYNRNGLTLEELKQDLHYNKASKLNLVCQHDKIIALLEKALKYGIIKKC